ncbi:MAG: hypothetical protein K6F79_05875 [Saccharofermentans sp.]|nr:hypothetical protein [Saccharofermentans sp.]
MKENNRFKITHLITIVVCTLIVALIILLNYSPVEKTGETLSDVEPHFSDELTGFLSYMYDHLPDSESISHARVYNSEQKEYSIDFININSASVADVITTINACEAYYDENPDDRMSIGSSVEITFRDPGNENAPITALNHYYDGESLINELVLDGSSVSEDDRAALEEAFPDAVITVR